MGDSARELARRRVLARAVLIGGLFAGVALVTDPPTASSWYPVCPSFRYLHLLCPGCGATRALAALLRGRIGDALRYNPLFVMVLPFLLAVLTKCYRRAVRPGKFEWPQVPVGILYGLIALAIAFMVARNTFAHGM